MKAITPQEAAGKKSSSIPAVVIETFNEFIGASISNGSVTISQDAVITALVKKGLKRREIFDKGWLDIEQIYEKAGWIVDYDKPAYNETYPATFTFTSKRVS